MILMLNPVAVTFWICSGIAVICALGVICSKKAVHSALFLAATMISLACIYASLQAPFLFVVQIMVYTGAVMMLFLFVVMLVGVDARESLVETLRGQRWLAIIGGLGVLGLLISGTWHTVRQLDVNTVVKNPVADDSIKSLADQVFSTYVFPFELASALLITAAVGTMVMAHVERVRPRPTQADLQAERIKRYAATGAHPGALPGPGVYARSNSIAAPALLPDGSVAEKSLSPALHARGQIINHEDLTAPTKQAFAQVDRVKNEELEA